MDFPGAEPRLAENIDGGLHFERRGFYVKFGKFSKRPREISSFSP